MFINYTNHKSSGWGEKQKAAAEKYGEIIDLDFPNVSPEWSEEELYQLADQECGKILDLLKGNPDSAVLCQGECALNFLIVKFLLDEGVKVVTAVTERDVDEVRKGEVIEKRSKFVFQKFRAYDSKRRPTKEQEIYPSVRRKNGKDDQDIILITAMGAGGYQTTVYEDEGGKEIATTGYAFDAVVKNENPNKMLLIGTENSDWCSLIKWYSKDKNLSEKEKAEGEELGKKFKDNSKIDWRQAENYICEHAHFDEVKRALIPNGSNEKEQKEYFNILFTTFIGMLKSDKPTRIILDISNGFRSIPLYMMMFIRYVGTMSSEKISYTVYYGMFDARNREKNTTPLVKLNTISELTDWMNAISEFRSMGSVKKLYQCLGMEKEDQKNPEDKKKIAELMDEFLSFDYALNSNNLYYLQKGIDFITTMEVEKMPLSAQAQLMLSDLRDNFANRFKNANGMWRYSKILVAYAQLCMEQGRYGSAAVSLQEGIITYIMERYVKTYLQEKRNLNDEQYEKYMQEYKNRSPVKEHLDSKSRVYETGKEEYLSERMKEFFRLYLDIKKYIRNVNAHIIRSEEVPNPEKMAEWLNHSIQLLTEDMEQFVATEKNIGFAALYEDFSLAETFDSSNAPLKAAAKLFRPAEDGSWILTDERRPERRETNQKILQEAGVDIEKIETLRKELLLLKMQRGNIERFMKNNLSEIPLIRKFLTTWIIKDGKDADKNTIRSYLSTRANAKGVVKSGYERMTAAMQNNLTEEVVRCLLSEEK